VRAVTAMNGWLLITNVTLRSSAEQNRHPTVVDFVTRNPWTSLLVSEVTLRRIRPSVIEWVSENQTFTPPPVSAADSTAMVRNHPALAPCLTPHRVVRPSTEYILFAMRPHSSRPGIEKAGHTTFSPPRTLLDRERRRPNMAPTRW